MIFGVLKMDDFLTQVAHYLFAQSWQIAVLVTIVAVVTLALRNRSAHVRYLLWLIVLAKCLVPPLLTIPLAILPQDESVPVPMLERVPTPNVEPVSLTSTPARFIPPARPVVARPAKLTTRQWLGLAWIVGVATFSFVAVIKVVRTQLWLTRKRKSLPEELHIGIEGLFSGLGLKRFPKVWLVEGIGQPFVWGVLRGGIYLPTNFVKVNRAEHRRGILGHELSHVLRFDAAVNLLQVISQAAFWFHPFVWWANRKIRQEREKCCDEMAIARFGASVKSYSTAIIGTVARARESARSVPSLAVAGSLKHIEERIRAMMTPGRKFYKHPSLPAAVVVALTALLAVLTSVVLTVRAEDQMTTESVTSDSPFNLGPTVNGPDYEWDPCISADGLSLYFLSRRSGGLGGADIWVITREAKDDPWGTPVNLRSPINSTAFEGAPCVSADGLQLYFTSDRPGGCGGYDLWVSERPTVEDAWRAPVNLGPPINSPLSENGPSISADGLSLYFSEHIATGARLGGLGGADIWVATRKSKNDPWGNPVNLGPTVNGPDADTSPSISVDGLSLFFMSDRPGFGKTDIWVTTRKSQNDPWGPPVNLGPPINTGYGEWNPDVSGDGSTLYFASGRDGSARTDIWQAALKASSDIPTDAKAKATDSLHEAAKARDVDEVKRLIAQGADVNSEDWKRQTALHLAAEHGYIDIARILIANGSDVNAKDKYGYTPLHEAAQGSHGDVGELLIANSADMNSKTTTGGETPVAVAMQSVATGYREMVKLLAGKGARIPPLHLAAFMGDLNKLKKCLEDGTDVDAQDDCGNTALHYAAASGDEAIVEFLIGKGAAGDAKNSRNVTPLYYAAVHDYEDIVDVLLAKGANVNAKDGSGCTLLYYAIWDINRNAVKLLIDKGANLNVKADDGETPLIHAIWMKDKDLVELLINEGADVNAAGKEGHTPMYWATYWATMPMVGTKDFVELLRMHGAKEETSSAPANLKPAQSLHEAAEAGNLELVKKLIAEGADVNVKDNEGQSALHYTVSKGHIEIARLLIAHGANVNLQDEKGFTPLTWVIWEEGS
jgi:ankyrin repeat protein/beta-lactamase regulating signal transducer with metallopeptidase domain